MESCGIWLIARSLQLDYYKRGWFDLPPSLSSPAIKTMFLCKFLVCLVGALLWGQCQGHILHYAKSHFTHLLDDVQPGARTSQAPEVKITGEAFKKCGNKGGICVSLVQCPAHVEDTFPECILPSGQTGLCCTTGQNHTDTTDIKRSSEYASPTQHELERVIFKSHLKMRQLMAHTDHMLSVPNMHQMVLQRGTPGFGHFRMQMLNHIGSDMSWDIGRGAMEMVFATKNIKDGHGLSTRQVQLGMINANVRGTGLGDACLPDPMCPHMRYRSMDGTCNNLRAPRWGSAKTPMERVLPPAYDDGIWSVRRSAVNGRELPNARHISSMMFQDHHVPHPRFTLMIMQFGQFITHDITLSPSVKHLNGSGISCCDHGGTELPQEFHHFACFPIVIPPGDSFYSKYDQKCMNLVRSMLAPRHDCSLGYAQQMNKVTHLIDGSMLYGSDPELMSELRTFHGGRLQMFTDFNRDLLPLSEDKDACLTMERGSACFRAGDARVNQQVTLVALHLLFTREHNRIAFELSQMNPHWNDELLFQEARRIVVAELQHILYTEYLPIIVGQKALHDFGLFVNPGGYSHDYNIDVNPSVTNEFTAAAFRFGHSTVDGRMKIMREGHVDEVILMPEVMFDPSKMRGTEFFDRMLLSLSNQPMQDVDSAISESLNRYLFRAGNPFGVDLGSINIQRGRDHGIAPYNAYRQLIGLPRAHRFEDFSDLIDGDSVARLSRIYASPDDVDLYVAGLHERHAPGAIVGPTFASIIADQFSRLRRGDRFFYEHGGFEHSFHIDQLQEIKKVTLSRIICDNSDRIELHHVSPNSFAQGDFPGNEKLHCNDPRIPVMNLRFWKENNF